MRKEELGDLVHVFIVRRGGAWMGALARSHCTVPGTDEPLWVTRDVQKVSAQSFISIPVVSHSHTE